MSEALPDFKLRRPASIDEAVAMMASESEARLCAGGTDLIVNMRRGLVEAEMLVDLTGIGELAEIEMAETGVRIGAGVVLRELAGNGQLSENFPAISEAAISVAGPGHREAATSASTPAVSTTIRASGGAKPPISA